jgi:hypothetical protein
MRAALVVLIITVRADVEPRQFPVRYATALSSFSAPRMTIFSASSGPAQPSPTIAQCLNGGLGWFRCETKVSIPLDAIRRPRSTPIWKLEASLKCRSCRKGRYAPPVHMIRLTEQREIAPYRWVHPDEER